MLQSLPAQEVATPSATVRSEALTPRASLGCIQLSQAFGEDTISLLAHEPAVVDPVDAAFDEYGRLWVVEMRDYPTLSPNTSAEGRIVVLEDRNSDGFYESSQVFASELNMPTGLAVWRDGVVVTVAGELLFLRDTDGDGECDKREQWLRGFAQRNEQLRANHPILGPDGWWYIACGLRGGKVQLGDAVREINPEQKAIEIGSRDIRFNPATAEIEAITGPAQFGLTFDQLGNRFFCSNRNPAVQVLLETPQLTGNPLAGSLPTKVDIVAAGTDSQVFPIVTSWTTSNLHAGQFTAACGVFFEHQEQEGEGDFFICEPTGSLVKRTRSKLNLSNGVRETEDLLLPTKQDWLASSDAWFRPVNILHAPGGSRVVVDMHRAVIEHPQWVPDELKNREDERWGNGQGRLYLVGDDPSEKLVAQLKTTRQMNLPDADSETLCELLSSGDQWLRQTASRLLLQSSNQSHSEVLHAIVVDSSQPITQRMECLKVLIAMGYSEKTCEKLLLDANTEVELLTVCLKNVANGSVQMPLGILQGVLNHTDPTVFRELLACLSTVDCSALPPQSLARIAESSDPYLLLFAAGALKSNPERLIVPWLMELNTSKADWAQQQEFLMLASTRLVEKCAIPKRKRLLERLVGMWSQAEKAEVKASLIACYQTMLHWDKTTVATELKPVIFEMEALSARSSSLSLALQKQAMQLLAATKEPQYWYLFAAKFHSATTSNEKVDALEIWLRSGDPESEPILIGLLESKDHRVVNRVVDLSLMKANQVQAIATLLRNDAELAEILGTANLNRLRSRSSGDAAEIFKQGIESLVSPDRDALIAKYREKLTISQNASRGKAIFQKNCATCHRIDQQGFNVGPDISDSRTKTAEQLLVSILDPNRAIDNNYFRVTILTDADKVIDGVIVDEQAEYVTLRAKEGKETRVLRSEIVRQESSRVSLMPEGMEAQISPADMADLIAYIKNWRYSSGAVPGLK